MTPPLNLTPADRAWAASVRYPTSGPMRIPARPWHIPAQPTYKPRPWWWRLRRWWVG